MMGVAGSDAANDDEDSQHLCSTTWIQQYFKGTVWRCGGWGGSTSSCGSNDVFGIGGTCNDEDIEVAVVAMVVARMLVMEVVLVPITANNYIVQYGDDVFGIIVMMFIIFMMMTIYIC